MLGGTRGSWNIGCDTQIEPEVTSNGFWLQKLRAVIVHNNEPVGAFRANVCATVCTPKIDYFYLYSTLRVHQVMNELLSASHKLGSRHISKKHQTSCQDKERDGSTIQRGVEKTEEDDITLTQWLRWPMHRLGVSPRAARKSVSSSPRLGYTQLWIKRLDYK